MHNPTKHADLIDRLRKWDYPQSPCPANADGVPLVREAADMIEAQDRDIAMRPSALSTLYEIREALGLNKYFSLDHLAAKCRELRALHAGEDGE